MHMDALRDSSRYPSRSRIPTATKQLHQLSALVHRLRAQAQAQAQANGASGTVPDDAITTYSHAEVVDTRDLASLAPCSARLARACADALDFNPHLAEHAYTILPVVRRHLNRAQYAVVRWALIAASSAQHNMDMSPSTSPSSSATSSSAGNSPVPCRDRYSGNTHSHAQVQGHAHAHAQTPKPPPEPLVRLVCMETAYSTRKRGIIQESNTGGNGGGGGVGCLIAQVEGVSIFRARSLKHARCLHLRIPPAIAVLAIVCAVARTRCFIRRCRVLIASKVPTIRISARGVQGAVKIDIRGNGPVDIIIRSRTTLVPSTDLVYDIADVVEDFDLVLAGET